MGWASGSSLLVRVWANVRDDIPEGRRADVLADLMRAFADEDCDTLGEAVQDDWPESRVAYEKWSAGRG